MATSNRGRPPRPETLERRRVEEILRNMPSHIPRLTHQERRALELTIAEMEKTRLELIAASGHMAPDEHAYAMGSLGDESMVGFEGEILRDDAFYKQRAKGALHKAGITVRTLSEARQRKIIEINRVLIAKIGKGSFYTLHRVAEIILTQWDRVLPGQRLAGEPNSLIRRGDGGQCPSLRTLERWLKNLAEV
jgi:hypothetical protein